MNPKTITKHNGEPVLETGPNPLTLIEIAIKGGMDIEKLEKLFEMQQRWEANKARKEFFEALALFQSKCPVIKKTSKADFPSKTGGRVAYKFADLGQIIEQIREPLLDCGLSYRWEFNNAETRIVVTCIITHKGGHSEKTMMGAKADTTGAKNEIQADGSTLSYLRRYTLTGGLGIGTAEDDVDANNKNAAKPNSTEALHPDLIIQMEDTTTIDELTFVWKQYPQLHKNVNFRKLTADHRAKIEKATTGEKSKINLP